MWVDPARSAVAIHVGRAGLFKFAGHEHEVLAPRLEGEVHADPGDLGRSSVSLAQDVTALKVSGQGEPPEDVPKVQAGMVGPGLLDVAHFPWVTFRSTKVEGCCRSTPAMPRPHLPNSFGGPPDDPRFKESPLRIKGDAYRYDHRAGNDDYAQAGALYRLMSAKQRAELIENIVRAMRGVSREIQLRQIGHFLKADNEYGTGVAKGLGIPESTLRALVAA